MRPTRTAAAALLGAAALGLSAPAAVAADTPVGSVHPSVAKPGGTVQLTLSNCKAWTAKADGGDAFGLVKLRQDHDRTFTGKATVSRNVRPGSKHTVKFWCGHQPDGRATLRIAPGKGGGGMGGDGEKEEGGQGKEDMREKPERPTHGTHGGEGGSIGGISTTTAAAGAGVIAAAALGGVLVMRRRMRGES